LHVHVRTLHEHASSIRGKSGGFVHRPFAAFPVR
jgi:hypothetical protein